MKVVINSTDTTKEKMVLEVTRSISKDEIRIAIKYEDGSGPDIVISRNELSKAVNLL